MVARDYLKALPQDLPAAVSVFLVALPISLGVALASNAPLASGLVAGVVGGIVVGLLSRSHLSVSGPAAALAAIVAESLGRLPSFSALLTALVLCGLIQIALGYLKAGVLADLVPGPVIKGLLAAIGIILVLNQLPHLLGDDSQYETDESVHLGRGPGNLFTAVLSAFTQINPVSATIGSVGLAVHVVWSWLASRGVVVLRAVPAPLAVVLSGIVLHAVLRTVNPALALEPSHLVSLPASATPGGYLTLLTFPDWRQLFEPAIWSLALVLALVASLESLLSVEAIDDLDPYQRVTPTNRELKAQGVGNLVCGLLGGLPVTSTIVRSSANLTAGARTRLAAVYHGFLFLAVALFTPGLVNLIPKASLAAVLIVIGVRLAPPSLFTHFHRRGLPQFLPFVITIVAILVADLLVGVLIGIAAGLYFVLRSNHRNAVVTVADGNKHLFRLRKEVTFLNKPALKAKLEAVAPGSVVYIDASRADFVDPDIVDTIEDFMLHAPLAGIQVELTTHPHRDLGFSRRILEPHPPGPSLVRGPDAEIHGAPAR